MKTRHFSVLLIALSLPVFAFAHPENSHRRRIDTVQSCQETGSTSPMAPSTPEDEFDEFSSVTINDPLEGFNRAMFKFNDGLYTYALRPVANGYVKVVPTPVRTGLGNFFDNIQFPIRFVSSTLQGKPRRAGKETGKFLVNTIAGLGGFIKISNDVPALADVPAEDLGQTFGKWGAGQGFYLVLPVLGPTSGRDALGRVGDYFLHPLNWEWTDQVDWSVPFALKTTDSVNALPGILDNYESFKGASLDPYISMRNGYANYREHAVNE